MPRREFDTITFAIVGSGGAGAITAGSLLIEAAGKAGWYGVLNRSVGAQIRGGEAAALVCLSSHPVEVIGKSFDLVVALDWKNADKFASVMPLHKGGLAIGDTQNGPLPDAIAAFGATGRFCPLKELAKTIKNGRENMVAMGVIAGLIGLPMEPLIEVISAKLAKKGAAAIEASRQAVIKGMIEAQAMEHRCDLSLPGRVCGSKSRSKRWLITGNEAVGLGAIRGGIRFAAAYPITPATEILEYLAPALTHMGGALVQAEDELSSVNMTVGASYGGLPAITATSGPGLALMMETLGLSAAAEVPIVVVDVMRCGPSTGIATKSEQSDLNIAVYGFHGDAPHVVIAPLSVVDCLFTSQWAVFIAEHLQAPVIVLSDQSIGQSRVLIDPPERFDLPVKRKIFHPETDADYARYALTKDGISPMALPGCKGGQYTADGLTHTIKGTPSANKADQQQQMDKRAAKIDGFDFGTHWGVVEGESTCVILTWGSMTGSTRAAQRRLERQGISVKLVALRQISPCPVTEVMAALQDCTHLLVVEQSHAGQFYRHLKSYCDLPGIIHQLNRAGPDPIDAGEITAAVNTLLHVENQAEAAQ